MTTNNRKRFGIAVLITVCLVIFMFTDRMPSAFQQAEISPTNQVFQNTPGARASSLQLGAPTRRQVKKNQSVWLTAYLSAQQTGIIGIYDGNQQDNPADNIFTIQLDRQPDVNDRVWLTYKLTGLDESSNVSCSVNDRLAFGGYLVKKSTGTNRQRLQLSATWLQKGENRIQFGLPDNAGYGYKVSDLAIEVEREANDSPLAVNAGLSLYDGKAYIHGFVQDAYANTAKVSIGGKAVMLRDGEFETIVELTGKHQVEVKAEINGKTYTKEILFSRSMQADKTFAMNDSIERNIKIFSKGKADILQMTNAQLAVNEKALLSTRTLSVTSLRDMDLPALDMAMTNVTDGNKGFRFLPHGEHFAEGATVTLKYDRAKIPDGYTENDIRTFYFDTNTNHWVALERDTVDKLLCMVVSKTTHFTDMINGVIKTPESPETQGYTPTMMNDIKAADPTSKIQLITPPTANNTGSANLTYDLEMPPARNGMSPKLTIQYNSDGGSGLLGEGWDLSIPSITVDTRWGVPRYSNTEETETYSMGGIMLATTFENDYTRGDHTIFKEGEATIGHRAVIQSRAYDRQFYSRVEGDFSRIIRKGSTPCNYTWEVTDKNGTKYIYGGDSAALSGRVKGHDSLVIAEWKLKRVEELHGDYIQYYYETDDELVAGSVNAKAIYLKRIEAGNAGSSKPHTIIYFDSKDTNLKRKRVNNARYGFLVSNYRLLNEVSVHFENENGVGYEKLRSYAFKYKDGALASTLLDSLIHKDNMGAVFAAHAFDYYDNTKSSLFKNKEKWDIGRCDKSGFKSLSSVLPDNKLFTDNGSALGATNTTSKGGSLYVGVGASLKLLDITNFNTAGVNVGLSESRTNGVSTFIDINGDGLPDYVYIDKNDGKMKFMAQKQSSYYSIPTFHEAITINGASLFSECTSTVTSLGFEIKLNVANGGYDKCKTFTKTSVYFLDVNNDGLVDIVNNGRVFFNTIIFQDGIAVPFFNIYSRYTPNPVSNNKERFSEEIAADPEYVSANPTRELTAEDSAIIDATPLQDLVRVWEAPYAGRIKIEGSYKLLLPAGDVDTTDAKNADGVRIAIQVGGVEKWHQQIMGGDGRLYFPNADSVSNIPINKGQRVYFRVQSGNSNMSSNGDFDNVVWSPVISYRNQEEFKDANGYSSTVFPATEGIVSKFGYNRVDTMLSNVRVKGLFTKPKTTDKVTLKAFLANDSLIFVDTAFVANPHYFPQQEVFSQTFEANTIHNGEFAFNIDNSVLQGHNFRFEVSSETNVRWDSIKWNPQICYALNGKDTIINAGVKYAVFSKCDQYGNIGSFYHPGGHLWTYPQSNGENTNLVVLKGKNGYIQTKYIDMNCLDPAIFDNVPAGTYWIEICPFDDPTLTVSEPYELKIGTSSSLYKVKAYSENECLDFGPMWRGWGQFEYNADSTRCAYPIEESKLRLPNDSSEATLKKMAFFPMSPDIPTKNNWRGLNDYLTIKGDTISCGRLNMINMLDVATAIDPTGPSRSPRRYYSPYNKITNALASQTNASSNYDEITDAPILQTYSTSYCNFLSIVKNGFSGNMANGSSEATSSYMDMNGDGYPESILKNGNNFQINYTNARGWRHGDYSIIDDINKTSCYSLCGGLGGGVKILQATSPTTTPTTVAQQDMNASTSSTLARSQTKLNLSVNATLNSDELSATICDFNGDGLPDKIYKDANGETKVRLNLGYEFSDPMTYGMNRIQDGSSVSGNAGLGLGINYGNGSFMAGYGIAATKSETSFALIDINGDGLLDKVWTNTPIILGTPIHYALNMGNYFGPDCTLSSGETISASSSTSESLNFAVTINLRVFIVGKISLTPAYFSSKTISRPTYDLRDVDADGYPDLVSAEIGENFFYVNRSNIAYSNKLKSVSNSLGGSFTLDYGRSEPTSDHPGGKWVMDSVTVDDGIAVDGPATTTVYEYSGGKYDRCEREFLGFSQVKIKELDTENQNAVFRITNQIYGNANIYEKGNLDSTLVTDGSGKPFQKLVNKYYTYVITKEPSDPEYVYTPSLLPKGYSRAYIVFSPLQSTHTIMYDGKLDSLRKTISKYDYYVNIGSDYGGHGELKEYKYNDGIGNYSNYITRITYKSDLEKYILGLPKTVTVLSGDATKTPYRQVEAFYEDPVNPAHLTQIRQKLNDADYAITTMAYDNAGNIKHKVLPSKMAYTYTYDPKYNMYLTQVRDTFGYVSNLENYDYRYGVPRTSTDINGNVMTTTIDGLGRVTNIKGPNETDYTLKFEYNPQSKNAFGNKMVPYAITKHYDSSNIGNDLETVTFVDGFGRPVQVKKDGVVWNGSNNVEAMIVSGMTKYDAFGRVKEAYYPVVENNINSKTIFNTSHDNTAPPTKSTYDILDRIVATTMPDSAKTTMEYTIEGGLFKKLVTDPEENKQARFVNGSDLTVKTEQDPDNLKIITSFDYDAINQLLNVTDAKGGVTNSQYDMGGRRTHVTHPASGTTIFEYDAGGNLTYKQTANLAQKGQKIAYKYDFNRLKEIEYPNYPENNVTYKYGASDATNNRKGRLICQIDCSGGQEFMYGKMGEITEVRRTLVIPNQAVATYVTSWNYDSWNRVKTMIYPDGETLTYNYNLAGLFSGLSGTKGNYTYPYVNTVGYDKFEQRCYMKYGNEAETNYTYDAKTRNLSNLLVQSTKINKQLMNNAYVYDKISNVLSVTNTATLLGGNEIGGQIAHTYTYDDLYRLKTASGVYTGKGNKTARYDLTMAYDNLHNITSKKQDIVQTGVKFDGLLKAGYDLTYAYANNPQQISTIADESYRTEETATTDTISKTQTYSYDANGNLLSVNTGQKTVDGKQSRTSERKLLWDEENRLLALNDNGYVSNYWYDAAGERTVKTSGDGEGVFVNGVLSGARTGTSNFTAYVNPYMVITNGGQCSKHIYIGSQRIVSKLCSHGTIADPISATKAGFSGGSVNYTSKYADLTGKIKLRYDSLGVAYHGTDHAGTGFYTQAPNINENLQYFYHSDHLGSSSLITNLAGDIVQHIEYVPFGEVFIEERNNTWNTPYKFNAKELDEETGLYYFGARYMDPRTGVWLSVDPMGEKYPNISSYVYCADNPVKYIDPDGRLIWEAMLYYATAKVMEHSTGNNNTRQIGYAMQHPINAYHVKNNLGVVAGNFQINIGKAIGASQNKEGTPQNAIRHTLWQALSARDLGASQAERAANSHEVTTNVNLNQRQFKKLDDADRTIDLLNNNIGRDIGEKNQGANNTTMATKVIEEYHNNGLWTVSGNQNDGFTIQKTKLTDTQYKAAIKEINQKGQNGLNKSTNEKK